MKIVMAFVLINLTTGYVESSGQIGPFPSTAECVKTMARWHRDEFQVYRPQQVAWIGCTDQDKAQEINDAYWKASNDKRKNEFLSKQHRLRAFGH